MRHASSNDWRKGASARKTKNHTIRQSNRHNHTSVVQPDSINALVAAMDPANPRAKPIRPLGAASASTACSTAAGGTVIDMTELNEIVDIGETTVTVQAGVNLKTLVDALAVHGREIPGSLDLVNRTVGGAVASACIGPSTAADGAFFARQVVSMTVVTPSGRTMTITQKRRELLNVFRMSYGLLGVIFQVTLKTRPLSTFALKQKKMPIKAFATALESIASSPVGLKFYLMPFKGHVYTELRRYEGSNGNVRALPWKVKDWGESAVLPAICNKLARVVPIKSVRYSLVDGLTGLSQSLLNNRLIADGSNAVDQSAQSSASTPGMTLKYSTWCFPASDANMVIQAYQHFCKNYYKEHKFRCDMPSVGFKLSVDRSALLSPSFDEPMFALRAISNPYPQWDDFVFEYGAFAQQWGGVPLFNQSMNVEMNYAALAYGSRLEFFRKVRRQMDPDNRMLNPFLAQYFC